jgi:glucan-binding YG repeat protein
MGRATAYGLVSLDGCYYFAGDYGVIATGKTYVWKTNGIMAEGSYTFDETGRMLGIRVENGVSILGEIVEQNGKKYVYSAGVAKAVGLVEIDGYYYFVGDDGLMATGKTYVWKTNGLLPENTYTFDAEGRMMGVKIVDGIKVLGDIVEIDGELYYYENGRGRAAGLIYRDGNYYFASDYGKLIVNQKFYIWKSNDLLLETTYTFDHTGKIVG